MNFCFANYGSALNSIILAAIFIMQIITRQIKIEDTPEVNQLAAQLGYPLSLDQTKKNIALVIASENDDAFVAVHENKIVGWIGVSKAILVEMISYCEINGLVVDENYRGKGIGKLLIEEARQWGKEKGNNKMRLRCNVIRIETHKFYHHLGFSETKKQTVFEIDI
jgi:GNAT superfamily N-acetyltransferase